MIKYAAITKVVAFSFVKKTLHYAEDNLVWCGFYCRKLYKHNRYIRIPDIFINLD